MRKLAAYLRERTAARIRIARLLPAAGTPMLAASLVLQVFAGLLPVAFIVATSAVVGRVPAAVEQGLDSPEWVSLRNALLVAGGLFMLQQLVFPLQWVVWEAITWRVDDRVRERLVAASFAPVGIAALEDEQTVNELGDIVDPLRGAGFTPGGACAGLLMLVARYLQWAVAAAFLGAVYTWWAGAAAAGGRWRCGSAFDPGSGGSARSRPVTPPRAAAATTTATSCSSRSRRRRCGSSACSRGYRSGTARTRCVPCSRSGRRVDGSSTGRTSRRSRSPSSSPASRRWAWRAPRRTAISRSVSSRSRCRRSS